MTEGEVLKIFGEVGAVIKDSHIVYTSDKHSSSYVNKDAIYPHTQLVSRLCKEIATRFATNQVDAVVAPALGGIILSQWVAHHLSVLMFKQVLGIYAEKGAVSIVDPQGRHRKCYAMSRSFVFGRGYDKLVAGKRVLVVEDVLTTGSSVREVLKATRSAGGTVVGLGDLCNCGGVTASAAGYVPKLISLVEMPVDSYNEADCPMCKAGVPINTTVGKGREFLARTKK